MVLSTWVDHIPFAYDLVAEHRPRLLVELGTHHGMSFYAFCQSMVENHVDGVAYAVDTWEGDDHTGPYGPDVFAGVQEHLRNEYHGFSYQLRMRFDEALDQFNDETVDLLHIDGFHTYDAVKNDFETWYPKVAPGGIILLHDVRARLEDFGVWRFWDELVCSDSATFTFNQGFGLGVLRKPGGPATVGPLIDTMFGRDENEKVALRELYVAISRAVLLRRNDETARAEREAACRQAALKEAIAAKKAAAT